MKGVVRTPSALGTWLPLGSSPLVFGGTESAHAACTGSPAAHEVQGRWPKGRPITAGLTLHFDPTSDLLSRCP